MKNELAELSLDLLRQYLIRPQKIMQASPRPMTKTEIGIEFGKIRMLRKLDLVSYDENNEYESIIHALQGLLENSIFSDEFRNRIKKASEKQKPKTD